MATANVDLLGQPLGTLTTTGSFVVWTFTMTTRLNGLVEVIANDLSFLYSDTLAGTVFARVPAGASVRLPIYKAQSWYFKTDASAATLYATCQG